MIVGKFEEVVKRHKDNIAVKTEEKTLTYGQLKELSDRLAQMIVSRDQAGDAVDPGGDEQTVGLLLDHGIEQVVGLLGVLKTGMIYVPLDSTYPEKRLEYMVRDSGVRLIVTNRRCRELAGKLTASAGQAIELLDIEDTGDAGKTVSPGNDTGSTREGKYAYIIYTSGSTGQPKGVLQSCENVCFHAENYIDAFSLTAKDRVTYISSFSTDGGFDDIYPALLSGATLCALNIKEKYSAADMVHWLGRERITVYHSVPTVLRYFMTFLKGKEEFPDLRLLITGGESLRESDVEQVRKYFPGVQLANFYGQTESSVNTVGFIDTRNPGNIGMGKPVKGVRMILLNEAEEEVAVLEKGEIFVASPYVAAGYWKKPEATNESFFYDDELGRVYRTGDLGVILLDGSIRFIGRKDHQVKIRGFRVEPGEIESHLLTFKGIKAAAVVSREKGGENYLCAYIEAEGQIDTPGIHRYLAARLPDYMVPAHIILMDRLPLIGSGKIDRGALPEPTFDTGEKYMAPRDETEQKLAELWAGVLGIEQEVIGIDHDFFQLGGHSLKAATLGSRIHKEFDVNVPVTEIFKIPTIRGLSQYIGEAVRDEYTAVPLAEQREYYELAPAQRRFYILQRLTPASVAFNMPLYLPLAGEIAKEPLERAFQQLIRRHESLRTSFEEVDDVPVQKIHEKVKFEIEYFLATEAVGDRSLKAENTEEREKIQNSKFKIQNFFSRSFDLSKAPLLRVGLLHAPTPSVVGTRPPQAIMIDMHHIIADGTSRQVLARDFMFLYAGRDLPLLQFQYKDFSEWQNRRHRSGDLKKDEEYWLNRFKGELPALDMPTDYPRPQTRSAAGARFRFTLGPRLTRQVDRLTRQTGTTLYMVLLAGFSILLSRYSGQHDIIIGSPTAGRYHADLENIIGLVIGSVMMRNFPHPLKTFREFLEEVKNDTLDAYEHQAYPFEALLEKVGWQEEPGRNPFTDVSLIVHNMIETLAPAAAPTVDEGDLYTSSKLDITLSAVELTGDIQCTVEYCTALFKARTIERIAGRLVTLLEQVVENPETLLSGIDIIGDEEKKPVMGSPRPCYPLSHPQKRIYYTEKMYPGTACNILAFSVRYNEILDEEFWAEAINVVIRKNDALRLRIAAFDLLDEPVQYTVPFKPYTPGVLDFSQPGDGECGGEERLSRWIETDMRKPFPFFNSDLFYFAYFKLGEEESGYYMKFHHAAIDGWALALVMDEIDAVYRALKSRERVDNAPNPSYLRFITYETEYLRSPRAREDREFWLKTLLPLPQEVQLSLSFGSLYSLASAELDSRAAAGHVQKHFVTDGLRSRILDYCKNRRVSIYILFLSALSIYVSRVTGLEDIVIGSAGHNRTTEEHRKMVGMFVGTFPIRLAVDSQLSFNNFAENARQQLDNIVRNHQQYPFDRLLTDLRENKEVGAGSKPDPHLLNINLIGHGEIRGEGFHMEYHFSGDEPTPLAIHINNKPGSGTLDLEWIYQVKRFSRDAVDQMHRGLVNILNDALDHPEKKLSGIEWVSKEEKETILHAFNHAAAETYYMEDKAVHQLFEEQAEKTPENVVVVGSWQLAVGNKKKKTETTLTYRELNKRSDQLAHVLKEKGVLADSIIGIMVEPSIEMIIGILGILKAGGAYLPIDLEYPQERIDYMLKDSLAKLLVTADSPSSSASSAVKNLLPATGNRQPATSLAYIIYTSGTTGRPKGVMVEHRNLVSYLHAFTHEFELYPGDTVIQQASFTFDAFVEELYPILSKGGKLAIPAADEVKDINRLSVFIVKHGVTMITASPLLLNELNKLSPALGIRIYISGGDVLKRHYVNNLLKTGVVYNTYGPTETTVCASYYECREETLSPVPIGKPIAGYRIYIMDKLACLLPVGIAGELCIAGQGVTRGYLNQPELTSEKFRRVVISHLSFVISSSESVTNDQCPMTNDRLYRTGDLACWLADGNIEFLGRIDRQVKIRGYRIEPGEIENHLLAHPAITDVVVTILEKEDISLAAFIVTGTGESVGTKGGLVVSRLREYLSRRLPGFMIPAHFLKVDWIPRTIEGKIDHKALLLLSGQTLGTGARYRPPQTDIEKKLETIWKELLGVEKIGIDDNFFELGGHSLKAISMVSRIHRAFNRKIDLAALYRSPSIREIARHVAQGRDQTYWHIPIADQKEYYSLSPAQKRLFILDRMGEASTAYNISRVFTIEGDLDIAALGVVFKTLIQRHESLRTSFHMVDDRPVQRVHDDVEFEIERHTPAYGHPSQEGIIKNFIRPFDLSGALLLRVGLVRLEEEENILMVDMHHIIADGVSIGILVQEFFRFYTGTSRLPELRLRYRDYAEWLNRRIEAGEIKKQETYWLDCFQDEIPMLQLPFDYVPPAIRSFEGNRARFQLELEETRQLKNLALEQEASLFMVLLALYTIFLSRLSGQEDMVVGTPTAGRRDPDLEPLIGMFVNTLALRNFPCAEKSFREFLAEVKENSLQAFENQDYPFEDLVSRVAVNRDTGRNPLFDAVFVLQNNTITASRFLLPETQVNSETSTLKFAPHEYESTTSKFDITLEAFDSEAAGQLFFTVEYSTRLFKRETIDRFIVHFRAILSSILANPAQELRQIEILSEEEKQLILYDFNDTAADYPADKTIHELFAEQTGRIPDSVAVIGKGHGCMDAWMHGNISITFRVLNEKSDQLAHLLREKGVLADSIAALMVHRSIEMVIGILGILKAGGAYLPIDPEYPEERINYMLNDSGAEILLTSSDLSNCQLPIINCQLSMNFQPAASLAYIIYTSGTTGKPKGVPVNHGGVFNTIYWRRQEYGLTPKDRVLQLFSFSFDGFVTGFFTPIVSGSPVVLLSDEDARDVFRIKEIIVSRGVTHFISVPSLYASLLEICTPGELSGLRIVTLAGETVKPSLVEKSKRLNPWLELVNEYGPTENTVVATIYRNLREAAVITIGKPIANTQIYILNRNDFPVPIGIPGQLCIAGIGIARGYMNRPELTAEKFARDVISHSSLVISSSESVTNDRCPMTNDRLYRTGDLARWLPDGNIEFLGRNDSQVKIRGYRIELGEIESRLAAHPEVKEAVVTDLVDNTGNKYLCAYVVPYSSHLSHLSYLSYLSGLLPDYMIPAYFVQLAEIPLTSSGKVDRKKLPQPEITTGEEYAAPGNKVEEILVRIWSEVLGLDTPIGIDANFFELGGHSLKATIVTSKIYKELEIKIPLVEVFKRQTIRGLAEYVQRASQVKYAGIEPVEKREYYALSSAQKRLYFLQQMAPESTGYNIPLVLPLDKNIEKDKLESTLKQLIVRHESLRASFIRVNDVLVQTTHDEVPFEIEYFDLAAEAVGDRSLKAENTEKREKIQNFFSRPFDLSQAPLIRSGLVKLLDSNHIWMVDMHHIVSDGTSHMVLTEDFISLYNEEALEPLRLQYKDFSEWQNHLFESGEINSQEDYWLELYSDAKEIPRLQLVTDYKRPEVFTFAGAGYKFMLNREDAARFNALGTRNGGTLYMNILAVMNTLFYKYTGQMDIIIGSGIAGRPHADLQRIIGMFVNTLAMRNYPAGEKTYQSFLKEVVDHCVKAFENQDMQFEELVEKLDVERNPSRNPLFDVSMVVQNFRPIGEKAFIGETSTQAEILPSADENLPPVGYKNTSAKFDMTFFVLEPGDDIFINIEYYTGIFKEDTIRRLSLHFRNIVKTVINDPSVKLKDIEIISEDEKKQVLYEFNDTAEEFPRGKTIHELFEEQAEKTPDQTAVVGKGHGCMGAWMHGNIFITFRVLNEKSNQLARYLHEKKRIQPGDRVGIWMPQSLYRPVCILGILKAGAAYVPLDPSLPVERIKWMINDADIGIVISEKKFLKGLNRLQWEFEGFHTYLCVDSFDIHGEEEVEQNELMGEELWHHVGETAVDDITGGGWVSSCTGEPLSREEMDEYGDNILKKLEPLLHPEMRVLEIGCASGISMYRIAPKVGLYYGTDLSSVIIDWNRRRVKEEGHRNIKLSCLAAHEIDQIEERNFDLVIINSVIQCFHGHNYLQKVIQRCIELLGEEGYLFIGDIMDQEKKDDLVRELAVFKYKHKDKNYTTKTDFSSELFLSRGFWEDLGADLSEIQGMEFSDKIYTIENELTKFRYDALITINKKQEASSISIKKRLRYKQKYQDDLRTLSTFSVELLHLELPSDSLAYIIYTSGTTGKPKGVMIEHHSLVNLCLWHNRTYKVTGTDHAALYASFGFDASVWELFPYLINGSTLHLIDDSIKLDIEKLSAYYEQNHIAISFLPTQFCEQFMETDNRSLKILLTGGEKLQRFVKKGYDLYNNYGPTENTVVTTFYQVERVLDNIPIGKPISNNIVYILDKENFQPRPVGAAGELWISGEGLARGYLNQPELTAEKFRRVVISHLSLVISSSESVTNDRCPMTNDRFYRTGDLARWLPEGNIEFLGRIDYQVKIRGYRIELGEIESRLAAHPEVKEAVVTDRVDNTGNKYLCAYMVPHSSRPSHLTDSPGGTTFDITGLKNYLSGLLPDYMIPTYFVQLSEIPLTTSGKVDRKKLPQPEVIAAEGYTAPRNKIEEILVRIWLEVLGLDVLIGIDADFFELGGHSLKATILTSKIHKELEVKIPLAEVFKRQTIRELAEYVQRARQVKYAGIEPVEKREYYTLSSAQKRLYFLQQMAPESTGYNIPLVLPLDKNLEKDKLESTLKQLIVRHESLRTSFISVNDVPVQTIHDEVPFEIDYFDLATEDTENTEERKKKAKEILQDKKLPTANCQLPTDFIRPFDLSRAPLIRSGLIKFPDSNHIWIVDIHHIVSDGTSHTVLTEDFISLHNGEELEPLRLHYKDFSGWQNHLFESGEIKVQEDYWLELYSDAKEIPRVQLPTDYTRPEVFTFAGANYKFMLDNEDAARFKALAGSNGGTLYMNILAALNVLFYKYTGQMDIIIGTGIAGRPHADLQRIIGMFVNTLAMRNYPSGEKTYQSFLKEVVDHSINAFENQDIQFEELVDKLEVERDPSRNPLFDITMVVQNFSRPGERISAAENSGQAELLPLADENLPPVEYENTTAKFDMTFFVMEAGDGVYIKIEYYTGIFKEDTVKRLSGHFKNIIKAVVNDPSIKLKDIDIISVEEKKQVLYEFNDTAEEYPRDKTIHRLFEEQVEKMPDQTAVVGREPGCMGAWMHGNISITFRVLNEKSNQLARYFFYEKRVRPDDRVGILMDSSLESIIAIMGVLKAGAAYLPIDPFLPEDRIKNIAADAEIGMMISQKRFLRTLNRLQWECKTFHTYLCMDTGDVFAEEEVEKSGLMDKELWEYVGKRASDDIEAGGWLSSYTGEPISAAEMDEYGDNALQKLIPLLHPGMRVLEIGCASGLTMYRVVPRVGYYLGTDLSSVIIEKNRERAQREGHSNVALQCLPAHEIDILKQQEEPFDLVIMNSVIQAFNGHNYLRQVIRESIDLLGDRGYLFIGDIMDQDLKEDLVRDLLEFQRANRGKNDRFKTKTEFSQELFISREFFRDLAVDMPVIREAAFSSKIHTIENELTKFRYDVILTIDKGSMVRGEPQVKHKYQEDLRVLEGLGTGPVAAKVNPANLAYVIYTSGSTGRPRGVMVGHGSLVNLCWWHNRHFSVTPSDRATKYAGPGFDASVWEIFPYLIAGAGLYIIGDEIKLEIEKLKGYFDLHHITIGFLPTQVCEQFMLNSSSPCSLRVLLTGGDKLQRYVKQSYRLVNNYGPTEYTVVTTSYDVDSYRVNIPIGKPTANTCLYILDRWNRLQPVGVPGELCIAGDGLARGYLNNPELTAEKFRRVVISHLSFVISSSESVTNDQCPMTNDRLYRTGDLARWLADPAARGAYIIEFLGRIDYQVKIRGYRIELGEIESCLANHPEIKEAVVMDRVDNMGNKYLCAYVVPYSSHESHESYLSYLSGLLPAYMIPQYFVEIGAIPLTTNGKTDRKALLEHDPERRPDYEGYEPPGSEIEEKIVEIWQDVLGIDRVGINDNFFEIGGDSIKAIQVTARMRRYGLELKVSDLFLNPTIGKSAACVVTLHEVNEGDLPSAPGDLNYSPLREEELEEYEEEFTDLD